MPDDTKTADVRARAVGGVNAGTVDETTGLVVIAVLDLTAAVRRVADAAERIAARLDEDQ